MSLKASAHPRIGRQVATPPRQGRVAPASPVAVPPRPAAPPLPALDPAPVPTPAPDAADRTHETAAQPDPVMVQAKHDLDAGQVDTDLRATAGLDARRRARLVPGPGGQPPDSGR